MNDQRVLRSACVYWTAPLYVFLFLGIACAAALFSIRPILLLPTVACCLYAFFTVVSLRRPLIFVALFLVILIALPPLYFSRLGEIPLYLSSFLLPIGFAVLLVRLPDFSAPSDSVATGLMLFLIGLGLSLPFAWWLSGEAMGRQSLLRWLLLAQAALVFAFVRAVARWRVDAAEDWIMPVLLIAAVASGAYGIVDFFWPIPFPHPAADQFIWLESAIVRRAQGVFYEASSFGNCCAIFLVAASAAYLAGQERAVRTYRICLLLFISIQSLAVFLSFSRSVWASVLVSLVVFTWVSGMVKFKRVRLFVIALVAPLIVVWFYLPELWGYFTGNRIGYFGQILADPNLVSSGRLETWATLFSIMRRYPQYLLFGVGYKTLSFTRLFHQEIITDNGFLNLFVETGLVGLAGFVLFSTAIFKSFWKLSHRTSGVALFWSALILSLWCGQWVQMLATDAYTYWRSMVVLVALTALVLNRTERSRTAATAGESSGFISRRKVVARNAA